MGSNPTLSASFSGLNGSTLFGAMCFEGFDVTPHRRREVRIFLSSTCYDLADVRAELEFFLKELDHDILMSDRDDFPLNPNVHRHDVCIENVKNADLFVLVIDSRFGAPYCKDSSKSITWAEALTAIECGVPIFAYVRTAVFNERETWKKNKGNGECKFTPAFVDDLRTYEFISELQSHESGIWIGKFDSSLNIKRSLESYFSSGHLSSMTDENIVLKISDFSGAASRYLASVLRRSEGPLTKVDLETVLGGLPDGAASVGIKLDFEFDQEDPDSLARLVRVRPADDDGSSWYAAWQITALGATVRAEIQEAISRL